MEKLLNLQTLSKPTQKKIRDAVGVLYGITKLNINDLIKLAKSDGVDLGKRKETQIKRTYEYFGEIENARIEEENKRKVEIERRMHPKKGKDFDILFNELEAWRLNETKKIKSSNELNHEEKKLAL
jgi:hypothetical protein